MPRTKKNSTKKSKRKSKRGQSGGIGLIKKPDSTEVPCDLTNVGLSKLQFPVQNLHYPLTKTKPAELKKKPALEAVKKTPIVDNPYTSEKTAPKAVTLNLSDSTNNTGLDYLDLSNFIYHEPKKTLKAVTLDLKDSTDDTGLNYLDVSDFIYVNELTVNITNQGDVEIKIDNLADVLKKLSQYLPINFFEIVFSSDNITTVTFKKTGLIGDSLPIGNKTLNFESA
tara:strand:+ start:114 stop:788 length:675 start_codon:yes stop_codon:yes gene_type:complete